MPTPRKSPAHSTFPKTIRSGSATVQIYLTPTTVRGAEYIQYTIVYYSGGQRIRKKFSDLKEAIQEGELAASRIASGELAALTLTSEDRAAYVKALEMIQDSKKPLVLVTSEYMEATRLLPPNVTLVEACRDFAKRHSEVQCDLPVEKLLEIYLASLKKGNRSPRHLQTMKSRLTRFSTAFKCTPKSIRREAIEGFLDQLGVADRTRKNEIGAISQFINWMIRLKYAPKDLAEEIQAIQKPTIQESEVIIWSIAEMEELLRHSPTECIPYIVIGGFCGLRPSEILRADWSDITPCGGYIAVRARKGAKARRNAPICEQAKVWLKPFQRKSGPISNHPRSSKIHRMIITAINARRSQNNQPTFKWKDNALRHSFGSYRVAQIKNIIQTAHEMGNSPQMIQRHYLHLVTPEDGEKFFSISPDHPAL
jgi:integrase